MIVWNDIEHLTKNYTNGIKKIDGLDENNKYSKNKISHNKNKFRFSPSNNDYGLDDKITIKPFNIKYDSNIKKLMIGKSTPSNILGKHQLSSGTIEAIKSAKKFIPKIDYSYVDPQYYQHQLKGKTNKDFILKEMTPGKDFAQKYVSNLPKRNDLLNAIQGGTTLSTTSTAPALTPSPTHTPSTSTRNNSIPNLGNDNIIYDDLGEVDAETKNKMNKLGLGLKKIQVCKLIQL